jgi:hypothetical protein
LSSLSSYDSHPQPLHRFNDRQLGQIYRIIRARYFKPSPNLIDLRFAIHLPFGKLYFIILIGKEKRENGRHHAIREAEAIGNLVAADFTLLAVNSLVSIVFFGALYLIKS